MAHHPKKRKSIGPQAQAIYDSEIRHLVEPKHHGEYITLDVMTGDYEIDVDDLAANFRMLERHSAETLFTFRIGYRAYCTMIGMRGILE